MHPSRGNGGPGGCSRSQNEELALLKSLGMDLRESSRHELGVMQRIHMRATKPPPLSLPGGVKDPTIVASSSGSGSSGSTVGIPAPSALFNALLGGAAESSNRSGSTHGEGGGTAVSTAVPRAVLATLLGRAQASLAAKADDDVVPGIGEDAPTKKLRLREQVAGSWHT